MTYHAQFSVHCGEKSSLYRRSESLCLDRTAGEASDLAAMLEIIRRAKKIGLDFHRREGRRHQIIISLEILCHSKDSPIDQKRVLEDGGIKDVLLDAQGKVTLILPSNSNTYLQK